MDTELSSVNSAPNAILNSDFALKSALVLVLTLLTLVAFANSLRGDFVYDDQRTVEANPLLGHWDLHTLKAVFTEDYWAAYEMGRSSHHIDSLYYRPIYHIFTMAVYELAGKSAPAWHLISVFVHLAAVLLVFLVLERSISALPLSTKERQLAAAFGAAIFAIHPVQSEATNWISASANSLLGIFVFGAFYCYLRHRERGHTAGLVAALILYAFAIFTKENAFGLPFIIAAYELAVMNRNRALIERLRTAGIRALPFACILGGYLAIRQLIISGMVMAGQNQNFPDDALLTFVDNLRTLPALLTAYMRLVLFPFNLSMMYDFGYVHKIDLLSFGVPLGLVLLTGGILLRLCKDSIEVRIATIWIIFPLLPNLNTRAFLSEEIIHDRYLYKSMFGISLLIALLVTKVMKSPRLRMPTRWRLCFPAVVLVILFVGTVLQNREWSSEEILWRWCAAHAPNSRIVHISLGRIAENKHQPAEALREYEKALEINPDTIDALNNAGFVYARSGLWPQATSDFERIVSLTPHKAVAHFNLSFAYAVQKRYADAEREQQAAIELDPTGDRSDEWRSRLAELHSLSFPTGPARD
jgi:protein O-mannosyl-transferase